MFNRRFTNEAQENKDQGLSEKNICLIPISMYHLHYVSHLNGHKLGDLAIKENLFICVPSTIIRPHLAVWPRIGGMFPGFQLFFL